MNLDKTGLYFERIPKLGKAIEDNNIPSVSLLVPLRSSSLVTCRWTVPRGIVGTAAVATDWAEDTVAAGAAIEGGRMGLHGECELPEALEGASGTPDDEYKSWLNCKT